MPRFNHREQFPSRVLCEELREASYPQEGSYFVWAKDKVSGEWDWYPREEVEKNGKKYEEIIAAPTISEMGEAGVRYVTIECHLWAYASKESRWSLNEYGSSLYHEGETMSDAFARYTIHVYRTDISVPRSGDDLVEERS